jgi:hypothetical protein
VRKMFAEAEATDAFEDAEFGAARGEEPPARLRGRADRRRRFQKAKQLLDKQAPESFSPTPATRPRRTSPASTRMTPTATSPPAT